MVDRSLRVGSGTRGQAQPVPSCRRGWPGRRGGHV